MLSRVCKPPPPIHQLPQIHFVSIINSCSINRKIHFLPSSNYSQSLLIPLIFLSYKWKSLSFPLVSNPPNQPTSFSFSSWASYPSFHHAAHLLPWPSSPSLHPGPASVPHLPLPLVGPRSREHRLWPKLPPQAQLGKAQDAMTW